MSVRTEWGRRAVLKGGLAATVIGGTAAATGGTAAAMGAAHDHSRRVDPPRVFATSEWGARAPREPILVENHPPTYIVVHHTAVQDPEDDQSLEHAFAMSRAIQRHHMDTRGWIDTGQQFTISTGGHITEGRHRSLEILDEGVRHVQGAHVRNHNSSVIGIENEGLYTTQDVPEPLWDSLVDLVTYMAAQYDIHPEWIRGHRDFNATQCPGDVLYARLPELRYRVAERLGMPVSERPEWPLLRPGDRGARVRTAQRLLADRGERVPVDGVYGPTTAAAVRRMRREHGSVEPDCLAAEHTDESGFLGADLWPWLVGGERSARDWKQYLSEQD